MRGSLLLLFLLFLLLMILPAACSVTPAGYREKLGSFPADELHVTTIAGRLEQAGRADGPSENARFEGPLDLAVDLDGTILVSDPGNHSLRRIDLVGRVSTVANPSGQSGNRSGAFEYSQFVEPSGLCILPDGSVFVTDAGSHHIRRIVTRVTGRTDTFAGSGDGGYADGPLLIARFRQPRGIAFDGEDRLVVVDRGNHCIRVVTPERITLTLAGVPEPGFRDGKGSMARFREPTAIQASNDGTGFFLCDSGNHALRRVDGNGTVTTIAGTGQAGHRDGPSAQAEFRNPQGIAVDDRGVLYVADTGNHCIRRIADGIVTTIAGKAGEEGALDAAGPQARFRSPAGLAILPDGLLVVADRGNHAVRGIVPRSGVGRE